MKKLIIAAGAIFLASTPTFAGNFDGYYAGIDGSYNQVKVGGAEDDAFSGRINAGYGMTHQKVYFAGEGNLDFQGFETSVDGTNLEKTLSYGITGIVGYEFTPTYMGYGLVGYERADIKVGGEKEAFDGIRYGGGVETRIKDNISARSELSYSRLKYDDMTVKDLKTTVGFAVRF